MFRGVSRIRARVSLGLCFGSRGYDVRVRVVERRFV